MTVPHPCLSKEGREYLRNNNKIRKGKKYEEKIFKARNDSNPIWNGEWIVVWESC